MFAQLHQVPTPDLSVEMLNALSAIMLAQGQESIWNKTEQGQLASEHALFQLFSLCMVLGGVVVSVEPSDDITRRACPQTIIM